MGFRVRRGFEGMTSQNPLDLMWNSEDGKQMQKTTLGLLCC